MGPRIRSCNLDIVRDEETPSFVDKKCFRQSAASIANEIIYSTDVTYDGGYCQIENAQDKGFLDCVSVLGLELSSRKPMHFSWFLHEVVCKTIFNCSDKKLPTYYLDSKGIKRRLSEREMDLTPDYWYFNNNRLNIFEVKTSLNEISDEDMMYSAMQKYMKYDIPSFSTHTGITVTRTRLKTTGLKIKTEVLELAYSRWLLLRKEVGVVFGVKIIDSIVDIPKVKLLNFGNSKYNYDDSWIRTFNTTPSQLPYQYGRDSFDISKRRIVVDMDEINSRELPLNERLTELPTVIPAIGEEFLDDDFFRTMDERRDCLLETFVILKAINTKYCAPSNHHSPSYIDDVLRGFNAKSYIPDSTGSQFAINRSQIGSNQNEDEIKRAYQRRSAYINMTPDKKAISDKLAQKDLKNHMKNFGPCSIDIEQICKYLFTNSTTKDSIDFSVETLDSKYYPDGFGDLLYCDTNLIQYLNFLQRFVEELSIVRKSAMDRSHKRFYCSKVGKFNMYIFSLSSGSDKHVFYDILFKGSIMSGITGDDYHHLGNSWYMSRKIFSMEENRMEQLMTCCYSMLCLAQFFQRFSKPKLMCTMAFLIMLDGKQQTIDMLQQFRYIYMKQTSLFNDTSLCLSKVSRLIRTRLQSHILQKIIMVCDNDLGSVSEDMEGGVRPSGLTNWITGDLIESTEEMITLSYMHYVISAKANDTMHGMTKVLKKVIEEELKLEGVRCEEMKTSDPEYLKSPKNSHEYSRPFMKLLSGYTADKVIQKSSSVDGFCDSFLRSVEPYMQQEYFSTMKKSTIKTEAGEYKRKTCLEAMLNLGDDVLESESIVSALGDLQEKLLTLEGQAVTVFKKDQQTGIREIFVMSLPLRICVAFCELFFKEVGKCLDSEMISTPEEKEVFDVNHRSKVAMKSTNFSSFNIDLTSSSDAKTWCQRWVMPAFCDFAYGLITKLLSKSSKHSKFLENMRNIIINTLNCITNKKIFPDDRIMETAKLTPDELIFDDVYRTIKNLAKGSHALCIPGLRAFKNESNMMQGVPHVLSSVIHSAYMSKMSDFVTVLVKRSKLYQENCRFIVISTEVSSDDSSTLLTVGLKPGREDDDEVKIELNKFLGRALLLMEECKTEMGALSSDEKTVVATLGKLKEFNSCWTAGVSNYFATIKFMVTSLSMGYHPVFRDRVSEALSSISQLYKEGATTKEIAVINKCLQMLHSRILLMVEDPYIHRFLNSRCPNLGVVPYLPPQLTGYLNLDILSLIMRHIGINNFFWGIGKCPGLSLDKNIKYHRFVKTLGIDRSKLLSIAMKNPMEFVRDGFRSRKNNIHMKALSPGIILSLARPGLLKIHAASSYTGKYNVVKVYTEDETKRTVEKINLHNLIEEFENSVASPREKLSEQESTLITPFLDLLEGSSSIIRNRKRKHYRRKRFVISYYSTIRSLYDMRNIILKAWREEELNSNEQEFIIHMELLEPRFNRNFGKSLESFSDILTMRNWYNSLSDRPNKMQVIIPYKPPNDRSLAIAMNLNYNFDNETSFVFSDIMCKESSEIVDYRFMHPNNDVRELSAKTRFLMEICVNPFQSVRSILDEGVGKDSPIAKLDVDISELKRLYLNVGNARLSEPTKFITCAFLSQLVFPNIHKEFSIKLEHLKADVTYIFTHVPVIHQSTCNYFFIYNPPNFPKGSLSLSNKTLLLHLQLYFNKFKHYPKPMHYKIYKSKMDTISEFVNTMKSLGISKELAEILTLKLEITEKTLILNTNVDEILPRTIVFPKLINGRIFEIRGESNILTDSTIILIKKMKHSHDYMGPKAIKYLDTITMTNRQFSYQGTRNQFLYITDSIGQRIAGLQVGIDHLNSQKLSKYMTSTGELIDSSKFILKNKWEAHSISDEYEFFLNKENTISMFLNNPWNRCMPVAEAEYFAEGSVLNVSEGRKVGNLASLAPLANSATRHFDPYSSYTDFKMRVDKNEQIDFSIESTKAVSSDLRSKFGFRDRIRLSIESAGIESCSYSQCDEPGNAIGKPLESIPLGPIPITEIVETNIDAIDYNQRPNKYEEEEIIKLEREHSEEKERIKRMRDSNYRARDVLFVNPMMVRTAVGLLLSMEPEDDKKTFFEILISLLGSTTTRDLLLSCREIREILAYRPIVKQRVAVTRRFDTTVIEEDNFIDMLGEENRLELFDIEGILETGEERFNNLNEELDTVEIEKMGIAEEMAIVTSEDLLGSNFRTKNIDDRLRLVVNPIGTVVSNLEKMLSEDISIRLKHDRSNNPNNFTIKHFTSMTQSCDEDILLIDTID
nr:MAG: L protein [Bat faecal associated bunyavirus 5]